MKIGLRIKYFREKIGVTQGYLAEVLAVSPQAVSKWETGAAYPDIMIIPKLAEILNVSCDALLTDGGKRESELIDELLILSEKEDITTNEGFFEKIKLLEEGLQRYPRSYKIMLVLAYTYSRGIDYSEYRDYRWQDKIIEYCERVYANSIDLHEKYNAVTLLCYIYSGKNNQRVIELAEQMPEIYQTRSALIYHGHDGDAKFDGMYDYCIELLDTAEGIMNTLTENAEARQAFEKLKTIAGERRKWRAWRENAK